MCSSRVLPRVVFLLVLLPGAAKAQVTTLHDAIRAAEAANRTIKVAELDRDKAAREVSIAKTHRFPILSVTALGSQPLTQLGITLERGSLGVYPHYGKRYVSRKSAV
jgi:outer membrane protein TolC